jgi:HK97 family phage prohead protease
MPRTTFDAISTVRLAADDPRAVEGIAVPYGIETAATELGREVFHPGAFAADVARWMGRKDGARMAFRPAHREKPVGTVTHLEDTPEGVMFRAVIRETPAGDDYLADVRDGLNGVSIEAQIDPTDRRGQGGAIVHRLAKLHAIAGSVSPAYDGARIALRDMEDAPVTETNTEAETTAVAPIAPAEREAKETGDLVVQDIDRSYGMTVTRAEAIYGPGTGHGILRDMQLAREGDSAAAERQGRYQLHIADVERMIERAGDVLSSETTCRAS